MIGRLHASEKIAAEIFKILKPTISRSVVYKVIQWFKNTGSYLPKVRSTPPRPVRTPKLINAIRSKLNRNPQRSARKTAKEANVSYDYSKCAEKGPQMPPLQKSKEAASVWGHTRETAHQSPLAPAAFG